MKKCLVLGAAGCAGSHILKMLIRLGYHVVAVVDKDANLWRITDYLLLMDLEKIDFSSPASLHKVINAHKAHFIINAVDYGSQPYHLKKEKIFHNNVLLAKQLLAEAFTYKFEALISLGSYLEYGASKGRVLESDLARPITDYGVAKACATTFMLKEALTNKLPIFVLRPFFLYGHAMSHKSELGKFFTTLVKTRKAVLQPFLGARDFVHVNDLVGMVVQIIQKTPVGTHLFNVGSGTAYTYQEVSDMCKKVIPDFRIKTDTSLGQCKNVEQQTFTAVADISLAHQILGWKPMISLEEGLSKVCDWFDNNEHLYQACLEEEGVSGAKLATEHQPAI